MFEKEAEEYLGNFADCANCKERWSVCADSLDEYCLVNGCCYATPKEQDIYIAGAEFGYNKANEWHYVKEELPELYKDVLVVFPRGDCDVKRLTNHNEWVGRGSWCSLTDVIAWKEIVLPELPKESE